MSTVVYTIGAELPDLAITWRDSSDALIDFSTGHTFTVKVGRPGGAAAFTKTTGITGAATDPNLTVTYLNGVDAGSQSGTADVGFESTLCIARNPLPGGRAHGCVEGGPR